MLCVIALSACAVSCSGTKTSKDYKLPDLGGLEPRAGYSFLCSWNIDAGSEVISKNSSAGILIDVDENCYLSSLSAIVGYSGAHETLTLKIQKWKGDYSKTIKSTPVYTTSVDVYDPGSRIIAHIETGAVGSGKYLCRFCNDKGLSIGFATAFEADEAEGVSAVKCYNGNKETQYPYKAYATFYDYSEGVVPTVTEKTKLNPDKAHVVLILGQSNATGQAMTSILKEKISAEDYAGYEAGFENILMYYHVDGGSNVSGNFVPVSVNQGGNKERFGPELGMADVLTEKYPGEKFYFIKASWSGAGLTKNFQDSSPEYPITINNINNGLKKLEKMGLDPEIFAIVWMQGETDSWYYDDTVTYAVKQQDYIDRVSKRVEKYLAENGPAFIDCGISDTYAWTLSGIINAQKEICDSKNVNYYYYHTEHLQCMGENDDCAHYDSKDMIEIGRLFGDGLTKVIDG